MTDIQKKLSEAEDWSDLSDVLLDVTKSDIKELKPFVPGLIESKSWVVRCDVLDVIGRYELSEFIGLVKKVCMIGYFMSETMLLWLTMNCLGKKPLGRFANYVKKKTYN